MTIGLENHDKRTEVVTVFNIDGLGDLLRHGEWADAKIWQAVQEGGEDLFGDRVSFLLHHIHQVQRAFLLIWREEALDLPAPAEFEIAEKLAIWGRQGHQLLHDFIGAATEEDLARRVDLPWREQFATRFERPLGEVTLGETAMQVVLHSGHHRAQVASHLRRVGVEPPLIDYIGWLWMKRPEPEWFFASQEG